VREITGLRISLLDQFRELLIEWGLIEELKLEELLISLLALASGPTMRTCFTEIVELPIQTLDVRIALDPLKLPGECRDVPTILGLALAPPSGTGLSLGARIEVILLHDGVKDITTRIIGIEARIAWRRNSRQLSVEFGPFIAVF
jgi:hypothetical protein